MNCNQVRKQRLSFNNVVEVYLFPKDNSDLEFVNNHVKELPAESILAPKSNIDNPD